MTEQIPTLTASIASEPGRQIVLHPVDPADNACSLKLIQGSHTLGAAADRDITLPRSGVEPEHCRIEIGENEATIVAESVLTWVNDEPIRRKTIRHGDRITIGPLEYEVSEVGTASRRFDEAEHHAAIGLTSASARQRRAATALRSGCNTSHATVHCATPAASTEGSPSASTRSVSRQGAASVANTSRPTATMRALHKSRRSAGPFDDFPVAAEDRIAEHDRQLTHLECLLNELMNEAESAIAQRRLEQDARDTPSTDGAEDVENLRRELHRRIEALRDDESRVCTRQSELDQAAEALTRSQRSLSQREQQLELRLELCHELEAALGERETDICNEAERMRQRDRLLSRHTEEAEERVAQLEWQLLEQEERADEWDADRHRLEEEIAHLQAELAEARSRPDDDSEQARRAEEVHQRLLAVKRWRDDLRGQQGETKNSGAEGPSQEQLAALTEITESRAELDRQREEFGAKVEQLAKDRRDLSEDREAIDVLRRNLQVRQQEFDEQQTQRTAQIAELEANLHRLDAELQQVCGERDEIRATQEQVADERAALEAEVAELRSQLDVIREEAESQTGEPQQRVEELTADYDRLQEEHLQLTKENSELQTRQSDLERERVDLHEHIKVLQDQCNAAIRELELLESRGHQEPTMSQTADDHTPTSGIGQEEDHFELVEDQNDVVEDDSGALDENETALRLRAEMAEMFGIGADVLTSAANRGPVTSGTNEPVQDADLGAVEESRDLRELRQEPTDQRAAEPSPARPLDADDPDSVASYMRNLMARNRGGRDVTASQSPAVPVHRSEPDPVPTETSEPAPESRSVTAPVTAPDSSIVDDTDVRASCGDAPPAEPVVDAEPQQADRARSNFELERQHLDSFRELANRSARSAVAKHTSATLKSTLLIQAIVTGACVAATVVLLTAPLWSVHSYPVWGCVTAMLAALMAGKLLQTLNRIRHPLQSREAGRTQRTSNPVDAVDTPPEGCGEPDASLEDCSQSVDGKGADEKVSVVERPSADVAPPVEDGPSKVNTAMPELAYDEVIPG